MGDRELIAKWLRGEVYAEALRMFLASGLPGGTSTQRAKNKAFADGCCHATKAIVDAIERGDPFQTKEG